MAIKTQKITAAAVLGMALIMGRQATAREQPFTLTVRVYAADADVTTEELAEVEAQATQVYEAVGVRLRWVHEGSNVEAVDSGTYAVRLVLLSGAKARQLIALQHVEEGIVGQAAGITRSAYIFCNRVITTAGLNATSHVNVLGYTIAHELGHLVLPPNSHSSTGIMRASMYTRTARLAYFTEKQGVFIRKFLKAASESDQAKITSIGATETMR
jgi:hypothetical protein